MSVNSGGKDPPTHPPIDSTEPQDINMQVTDSGIFNTQGNQNVSTPISSNIEQTNPLKDGNTSQLQPQREKQVFKYESNDQGPYHLYVENNQTNFSGRLNSLKVGDLILSNFPELDNKILSIDTIGRNRIRIKMKDPKNANYLVSNKNAKVFIDNNLDIYVPKFIIVRQGVIRDIATEFSEEYLKNKIKSYDNHLPFEVLNVKRINRKVTKDEMTEFVPTKSCVVSFKTQILPKYVIINKVIKEVETYKQKVLLCFNCLRYGHLGGHCKSHPRCFKCNKDHNSKECTEEEISPKCFSCMGDHFTINLKDCPEFHRQKLIKETMSSTNLNYHDANKQIPRNTYASITANRSNNTSNIPNKNMTFQNMSIPPPTRFELLPSCSTRPPPNYNIFGESPSHHTQTYSKVHHKQSTGTFHKPVKMLRPNSPDPIEIAHRDIVSQPRTLGPDSNILTNNSYVKNLNTSDFSTHHSGLGSENVKIILELVANIISTIRRTNNYDISKTELEYIISKQLNIDSSENTLNSQIQYKK